MSYIVTIETVKDWKNRANPDLAYLEPDALAALLEFCVSQHEELTSLRAQLAERDAALSECVKAFRYVLNTPQTDPDWIRNVWGVCYRAKASLHATAQANAKIIEAAEEQELASSKMGNEFGCGFGAQISLSEACERTNQAVREKKELKP